MIPPVLLAAALVDAIANPYSPVPDSESGAARLAALSVREDDLGLDDLSGARPADVPLAPDHVWRWAVEAAKETSAAQVTPEPPPQPMIDELYENSSDWVARLLLVDAVLTHPAVERRFEGLVERGRPAELEDLPDVWPRALLQALVKHADSDGKVQDDALLRFCMLLLQVGTPVSLLVLGAAGQAMRERGSSSHPLFARLREAVAQDPEIRRWLNPEDTRFT